MQRKIRGRYKKRGGHGWALRLQTQGGGGGEAAAAAARRPRGGRPTRPGPWRSRAPQPCFPGASSTPDFPPEEEEEEEAFAPPAQRWTLCEPPGASSESLPFLGPLPPSLRLDMLNLLDFSLQDQLKAGDAQISGTTISTTSSSGHQRQVPSQQPREAAPDFLPGKEGSPWAQPGLSSPPTLPRNRALRYIIRWASCPLSGDRQCIGQVKGRSGFLGFFLQGHPVSKLLFEPEGFKRHKPQDGGP